MFRSWLTRSGFCAAVLAGSLHGQVIVQSMVSNDGDGGDTATTGNLGQTFLPADSGISVGSAYLVSFTFYKSGAGVVSHGSRYLHIATDMNGGIESGFVGSSSNAVDWDTTNAGDPLVFDFSGLALDPNTTYFALFSDSPTAGNLAAGALRYQNSDVYVNGSLLHDGGFYTQGDAQFTAAFSAVPEPATSASLAGLIAIAVACRRRRANRARVSTEEEKSPCVRSMS
jgi:hypothetical protein